MEKPKIGHRSRLGGRMLPYFVMSLLIAIMGIGIESAFYATDPFLSLTLYQISMALFTLRLVPVLLQVVLIERFLRQSMRGWFASTVLGTLGTLFILGTVKSWSDNPDVVQIVGLLTVYGPIAAFQSLWLWRRVKKAWLWPLSIVLIQYVLPGLWMRFDSYSLITTLFNVHSVIAAGLQAILLYVLLTQPKNTEKAKVDFAVHEQRDDDRLARLQERDQSTSQWDYGDEQTLHSEA